MADDIKEPKEDDTIDWKPVYKFGALILFLWFFTLSSFLIGEKYSIIDIGERGTFGDMFGGLNALFSGFAFLGIIFTIFLQRKDLKLTQQTLEGQRNELELQRIELNLTRKTLEAQRKEMATQNKTMKLQQFESTFFSLLRMHNDIVDSIDVVSSDRKITKGRDCIALFRTRLAGQCKAYKMYPEQASWDNYQATYMKWFKQHETELGHYFRTLYNIIKFVDKSSFKEKGFYVNLIRAQLSAQELALLFYNCLNEKGIEKFKPLVEKYSLLKTVPDHLLLSTSHKSLYKALAFGKDA